MTKKKTGRPESFNAKYFSHSVHENDELKVMMMKYKSEGYMAYYRLMACVAKADLHRIELKNEVQKNIFIMNMGVNQEIIDFLFNLLLQTGLMNAEQWEKNQTIYLDKFVKQFKKLWYDRDKSIPDADGKYNDWNPQKDGTNKVSRTGNGYSIVEDSCCYASLSESGARYLNHLAQVTVQISSLVPTINNCQGAPVMTKLN